MLQTQTMPPPLQANLRLAESSERIFQESNELYQHLPVDDIEHLRLGLQDTALFLALEGNYPARQLVRETLAQRADRRVAILDIGTGPGTWVEAMAREFPHAEVVGVDLALPQTGVASLPNCRYIKADITEGLGPGYDAYFDLVQARSMLPGVGNLQLFIDIMSKIVRPGGMIIIGDGVLQFYDDSAPEPKPLQRDSCAMQKLFSATRDAMVAFGTPVDHIEAVEPMFKADTRWTGVDETRVFIPVGAWQTGVDARAIVMGSVMGRDAVMVFGAMRKMLLTQLPEREVDELVSAAQAEAKNLTFKANSIWRYVWAIRA